MTKKLLAFVTILIFLAPISCFAKNSTKSANQVELQLSVVKNETINDFDYSSLNIETAHASEKPAKSGQVKGASTEKKTPKINYFQKIKQFFLELFNF